MTYKLKYAYTLRVSSLLHTLQATSHFSGFLLTSPDGGRVAHTAVEGVRSSNSCHSVSFHPHFRQVTGVVHFITQTT
jgi:hypothetical protein